MLDTVEATLCCVDEDESDLFETSIYGLRFAVSSNEPSFMAWVRHHFSALDCSSPARAGAPGQGHFSRIHVHISDDGEHVLSAGVDYPTVGSHSWGMMQAYTERAFTRVARRHMAPMYVVHAGAVAYQGRGLLFPAFPGSGKSTLVAGLALSGFDYYTDEVSVLTTGGRLLPYPKRITLKRGGWKAVVSEFPEAAARAYVPVHDDRIRHMDAPTLPGPDAAVVGSSVDFVVFPQYAPEEPAALKPLAPSEALGLVAQRSLNLRLLGNQGFEIICGVIEGARCYELSTNNLSESVELIRGLVDGS